MRTAIAIFCKTPGRSPVKTRLAAGIGKNDAEELYRLSISAVNEVVLRAVKEYRHQIGAFWAVAEEDALMDPVWNTLPCIWTGEGELGERIHHVFEELFASYEQVVIIGSDSPQMTTEYIIEALDTLTQKNVDGVIGPCRDGGFVLFGSKIPLAKSIWTDVQYSRVNTLGHLMFLLHEKHYRYRKFSALGDVDTYDDLIMLYDDFIQMGSKMQQQQKKLFVWLSDYLMKRNLWRKA